MNQKQANILNMYQTVIKCLDNSPQSWTNEIPIVEIVNVFKPLITSIETAAFNQQAKQTTGITSQKTNAEEIMLNLAYNIALKTKSYASKANNLILKEAVGFSKTELSAGSEREIINRCAIIAQKANEYLNYLGIYKVTATDITNLSDAINAFKTMSSDRTLVSSERSQYTASLAELFVNAKSTVDDLDDLVESLVEDQKFVETYFASRKINSKKATQSTKSEQDKAALLLK